MDLRKLRHRPESELARFKNGLNRIVRRLRYLVWVLLGVSLLISFLLFFVFGLRLMPPKQKAPTKIYGTVFPSQQEAAREERVASENPQPGRHRDQEGSPTGKTSRPGGFSYREGIDI